jgi:hypothetical protein
MSYPRGNLVRSFVWLLLVSVLAGLLSSCNGVFCFSSFSSPVITTLTPTAVLVGGSQVQLTIIGSDFSSGAVIIFSNGALLQPSSVTSSEIIVIVPGTLIATPGNLSFRVRNDCGALSNFATLRINN